jgi:acetate kinase
MERIAVINAGSSSIKFALFECEDEHRLLFRGQIENIGVAPRLSVEGPDGDKLAGHEWGAKDLDHKSATKVILETSIGLLGGKPVGAVGHRVVHGGTEFAAPTLVTKEVIAALKTLCPLAPLHQPHNIAPIEAIQSAAPHIPQVACFDTAYHQTNSRLAYSFALPRELTDSGVRKYGFHGLSYDYVSGRLRELAPDDADKRIIIAHLGNGASLCAIHQGRSVATTMGFTAVDGLVMGTRCGSIDPGVLIYLMDERRMDARAIERLLYQESGLLGVSGISSDMRTLLASPALSARFAIDIYVYRIRRELGSLAAALGGLDAIVFTGGIGEHAPAIRERVCRDAAWLGVELAPEANARGGPRISAPGSRVSARVVPTNEELMIARHAQNVLDCA